MTMSTVNHMSINVENVHIGLARPSAEGVSYLIQGSYEYYHYICDGYDDRGWGCGYRTLQTICSWINRNIEKSKRKDIPSIYAIQNILVLLEDKPPSFLNSREWIGSFEVCLVIDHIYDIPCKIMHIKKGDLKDNVIKIREHFEKFGSPIMMGGDLDCSSKGIMGIHMDGPHTYLLIADPHFVGRPNNSRLLQQEGWVQWQPLDIFLDRSFYNMCLPQIACQVWNCKNVNG